MNAIVSFTLFHGIELDGIQITERHDDVHASCPIQIIWELIQKKKIRFISSYRVL